MTKTPTIPAADAASKTAKGPSKLDRLVTLLTKPDGATMAEMIAATGWQAHSVRGALAGQLRKKGHATESRITDGVRRWLITGPAASDKVAQP